MNQLNDSSNKVVDSAHKEATETMDKQSILKDLPLDSDASSADTKPCGPSTASQSPEDSAPQKLHISYLGMTLNLDLGETLHIGRHHQEKSSHCVSRDHALLGRDQKGIYIVPYQTTNGTYVRKVGQSKFDELKPGVKYYAREEDVIHMGGSISSRMYFFMV